MSRTLSLTYREAHDAEQDGAVIDVLLLTITHTLLSEPIRLSTDPTTRLATDPDVLYGTISRGETYFFLPIAWALPDDGDEAPPAIRLQVANFSRDIIALLRSATTPATVLGEVVSAADPDTVEIAFPDFDLSSMNYDDATIELTLTIDSLVNEPVPAGSFTPAAFGGLF